ncbi:MAG: NTP transferase domain-containing protein [Planctomycetota bacterium]|jgi:hypothetical protein
MQPTLVILAGGRASRYGALKQFQPVGPGGATIMDYTVYDARRAGFGKVVFVLPANTEQFVQSSLRERFGAAIPVACVPQRLADLPERHTSPPGRTKPWGTGQAVLAAEPEVSGSLGVVNADDFYGARSFAVLASSLRETPQDTVASYAVVGFPLRNTLSDSGPVNRAVCSHTADDWLEDIVEITGIEKHGADGRCRDATGATRVLEGGGLVSMNIWGFSQPVFNQLREGFRRFVQEKGQSLDAEFYLPTAIRDLIRYGHARVRLLRTDEVWCGLTHRGDRPHVVQVIREAVARGDYPDRLWD